MREKSRIFPVFGIWYLVFGSVALCGARAGEW